jgi:hypothetical protein
MRSQLRAGVAPIVAVALGIGLAGCASDTKTASSPPTPARPDTETSQAAAPEKTIAEYIKENNITETTVRPGDPGSPTIRLPLPEGWRDMGNRTPEGSYVAIEYGVNPTDPATIVVYVSKLTGNVDGAKILEYAPAEIQRLPGYEGPKVGGPTKVGGFDATQIGGRYIKDGVKRTVGQMTAVIPGQDAIYVLQLNAKGPISKGEVQALGFATDVIAKQAKITP